MSVQTARSIPKKKKMGQDALRTKDGHVGSALRSAYQQTVREDVPQEFLDLLSKLA